MIYTYFIYIIKRKQVDNVFFLCKKTYLQRKFLLEMSITYLLYLFVSNTKMESVKSKICNFKKWFLLH